ncbi:MAG: hypothetical protein V1901_04045 [Patescibacteria group bacterium]
MKILLALIIALFLFLIILPLFIASIFYEKFNWKNIKKIYYILFNYSGD